MGVALLILLRAPAWHLARRNLFVLWCLSASPMLHYGFNGPASTAFELVLSGMLVSFAAGLLVWNVQEFALAARPVPRLHRACAVAAGVFVAATFLVHQLLPYKFALGIRLILAAVAFFAVAVLAGLARAYRRSGSFERRQVRWVSLGISVFVLGTLLAWLALLSAERLLRPILHLDGAGSEIGSVVRTLASLGIPIGILVSVIGYRWLDVDRLISATASYTIVGLAVLGSAAAVLPRLAQAAAPALGVGQGKRFAGSTISRIRCPIASRLWTSRARHIRFMDPKAFVRTGNAEPFTRSNRRALFDAPCSLETRSVISAISRTASTSALMRTSSPCCSSAARKSRMFVYARGVGF